MSKRAFIVGINQFAGGITPLRGCINDTEQMNSILTNYFGFEDIKIETDGGATVQGIRDGLAWLLSDYEEGGKDVRVFHFSSHGTQVPDQGQEEWEGKDEVIVPHDHDWYEPFRDDDLRQIFDGIPENVNFTFIADCCHSGTIQKALRDSGIKFNPRYLIPPRKFLDQIAEREEKVKQEFDAWAATHLAEMLHNVPADQYVVKMKEFLSLLRKLWQENRFGFVPRERHVLLAGCEDRQTAADAYIDGEWRGAFTWALSKAVQETDGKLTYGELIAMAGANLDNYSQKPQLECPTNLQTHQVFAPLA